MEKWRPWQELAARQHLILLSAHLPAASGGGVYVECDDRLDPLRKHGYTHEDVAAATGQDAYHLLDELRLRLRLSEDFDEVWGRYDGDDILRRLGELYESDH